MEERFRIGFDAKRYFLNHRGLGNYSRNLVEQLARHYPQHRYYLYSPSTGDQYVEPVGTAVLSPPPRLRNNRLTKAIWRSIGIPRRRSFSKLDLYHGLSHELPLLTKVNGPKLVVTIHDLIFLRAPKYYPLLDRQIYLQKIKHACKKADLIIAISEQTSFDLQKLLGVPTSKIVVRYQSIDEQYFLEPEPDELERVMQGYQIQPGFLLYVGAIEKRKNVQKLVKLMKDLPKQRLLIVGRGSEDYVKKIKRSMRSDNIRFLHTVPTADLPSLYRAARMLVYPSSFEGFGLPVAEAAACGTPVITTAGGCFPEAGGQRSIYVDPKRKQLLQAIRGLIDNPARAEEMRHEGMQHANKFRGDTTSRILLETYQKLIEDL